MQTQGSHHNNTYCKMAFLDLAFWTDKGCEFYSTCISEAFWDDIHTLDFIHIDWI